MRKSTLLIDFADMWPGFEKENNILINILRQDGEVKVSQHPDILFFGPFGRVNLNYDCTKVFFTGEPLSANYLICDYAINFDFTSDRRQLRFPIFLLYHDIENLTRPKDPVELVSKKTRFCNFLYSNGRARERIRFFEMLSRYKQVDSGGKILNNLGYRVADKWAFLKQYKFTISFENCSRPGYTSEKIYEPMIAGSIPIYWGNPLISRDFNTESFINVHDHASLDMAIERIIELDRDDAKYLEMFTKPWLPGNKVPEHLKTNALKEFLGEIAEASMACHLRNKSLLTDAYLKVIEMLPDRLYLKSLKYIW